MKAIESTTNTLKIKHEPNLIQRLFGAKPKIITYRRSYREYVYHNCAVWYFNDTGKEVGLYRSKRLEELQRAIDWGKTRTPIQASEILQDNLFTNRKP